jgi:hypothetical protein
VERQQWFRIGKESYQILARTMVEALRGSANLDITGRRRPKNRCTYYHLGDATWKMIEKQEVPSCQVAWRFSDPVPHVPPRTEQIHSKDSDDQLVGFFDLLAMIQAECFMSRSA